ncbi:MAG: hypothetical protein ACI8P3_004308 [Saprospiraceae bacterium]|jgi:hypothetical protein
MNLRQAEIILEKITRLYKTMKIDERNIDVFEQDLMLSYIRQLYDSFAPNTPVSERVKPVLPPIEKKQIDEVKEPVKAAPVPKPVESKAIETPVVVAVPKPVAPPTPPVAPVAAPETGLSPADRIALFEVKDATDLSEKLSQAPIRDLTKAMGLNDKIFTINELFGGDSKAFDDTIRKLNTFITFDTAKDFLATGAAYTYDWANRGRKKKAINFINLVKRRYN